jgi:hypothetical protein
MQVAEAHAVALPRRPRCRRCAASDCLRRVLTRIGIARRTAANRRVVAVRVADDRDVERAHAERTQRGTTARSPAS